MEAGTGDEEVRTASKAAPGIDVYSYARYVSGGQGEGAQVDALAAAAKAAGISEVLAFHSAGWVLGMTIADALRRCEAPCTPQQLDQALANTHFHTGGLTAEPTLFTHKAHYGPSSYDIYHSDRNRHHAVSNRHVTHT